MRAHVVDAAPEHVQYVAPRLRPEDRDECLAHGANPLLALYTSVAGSERAWAAIGKDGKPFALFGIGRGYSESDRSIWLLATPEIKDNAITFLKQSRWWVDQLNAVHPLLWNWTYSRNELHIAWLRWLGFTFINRGPLVADGPDFIHFVRINPCAQS